MDSQPVDQPSSPSSPSKTNPWMVSTLVLLGVVLGVGGSQLFANFWNEKPPTSAVGLFKAYAKELGMNKREFNECLDSGKYKDKVLADLKVGIQSNVNGTPAFFVNGRPLEGAQPYSAFQKLFESLLNKQPEAVTADSDKKEDAKKNEKVKAQFSEEEYEKISNAVSAGGISRGTESAPIVMVEFSDFQCPFCAKFFSQTLSQIEENYIKTGKVRMIYRHFPLDFHPHAEKAAEASECANDQGKFWEMHDKIFEGQKDWAQFSKTTDDQK